VSKVLFVRELTAQERAGLRRLVRGGTDASAVRRAQMVLLSSRGKTAAEIAPLWGVTGQCVRKVINRFNREGLEGLPDRPGRGRHGMTHLRDPNEYDEKKAFLAFVKKKAADPAAGFGVDLRHRRRLVSEDDAGRLDSEIPPKPRRRRVPQLVGVPAVLIPPLL
jgi:hypothetical protein